MDPLTHTLVGATCARTRLGRGTRFAGAAWLAGANLPDVDVLAYLAGADAALGFRRGWTHGIAVIPVLPLVLTGVLLILDRLTRRRAPDASPARAGRLLWISGLAVLTHPALDWLNTYGVRFLEPFHSRWYYGDTLFIVDPWMWLMLGGAVYLSRRHAGTVWPWLGLAVAASAAILGAGTAVPAAAKAAWLAGLVAVAVADRRLRTGGRGAAVPRWGLLAAAAYVGVMLALSSAAGAYVRRELRSRGSPVHDLMVAPVPANPLRWDVLVDTDGVYDHGSFYWIPSPALVLEPTPLPKPRPGPVVDAALAAPQVRGAVAWMRFPFVEIDPAPDGGYTVFVLDARYVRRRTRGFGGAVVELDRDLRPRP